MNTPCELSETSSIITEFDISDPSNIIGPGVDGPVRKRDIKKIAGSIRKLYPYLANTSMTLESLEPQVGKSRIECILLWLQKFVYHQNVVLILDDKLNSLNQFLIRDFPTFNSFIDDSFGVDNSVRYHLKPKVLMASTPLKVIHEWICNKDVIVTTMNCRRLSKLNEYLQRNRDTKVVLVYDEADMRFADMKPESRIQKETYARLVEAKATHIYYITATAFACVNSPHRRRSVYKTILPTVRDGYEFRGYHTFPKNFVDTSSFKTISNLDDNDVWEDFVTDVSQQRFPSQPSIALVNIAQKVVDHEKIAKSILRINPKAVVLIYNNVGVVNLDQKQRRVLYVFDANGEKKIKAKIISQAIQYLKDQGCRSPIFIVAGKRASRAETFKSVDHQWVLTRMLLALPTMASMESIVQYLRVCGIYSRDAPMATIDISLQDHMQITHSLRNKLIMAKDFEGHSKLRPRIPKLVLHKIRGGFSRKECEDGSVLSTTDKCCYETHLLREMKAFIKTTFPKRRMNLITRLKNIEVDTESFPFIEQFRDEGNLRFLGKRPKLQHSLQKFIKEHLGVNPDKNNTLQIAYYAERERELNSNPLTRPKQKYAKFIALSMNMIKSLDRPVITIPVVEYLVGQEDVIEDEDVVYVWQTTTGTYRCAVTKKDTLHIGKYIRN